VSSDGVLFEHAEGFADIESEQPMTMQHRHCIASVTKTMVALCAMALVDEGRLALEDRVVDLLPDVAFHGPAETMTVCHLLTHTSGIGEAATREAIPAEVAFLDNVRGQPGTFKDAYPSGIVLEVPPGTLFAYANNGYVLLGEILRRKEASDLDSIMRRRIFDPLGMEDTDCSGQPSARLSTPYHRPPSPDMAELMRRAGQEVGEEPAVDGTNIRGTFNGRRNPAALARGGVQSTMVDMQRYAAALLRGGEGIVRPETFAAMIAPQWCPDDRLVSWGLGFVRSPRPVRSFGHTGGEFGGWGTNLAVFPNIHLAVVFFQNLEAGGHAPSIAAPLIIRAILNERPKPHPDLPVDASLLALAPGVYEASGGPLTTFRISTSTGRIQLKRQGDELWLYARRGLLKQGIRLQPVDAADATFLVGERPIEPMYVSLMRDAGGRVDGLRMDRLVHMTRTEQVEPWV
jgi:CubicO group peptidase (beta-lactamase class C family)